MLTKLTIRNFKRFDEVEIELGNPVVFVGPNNSGKTSAMQALALWDAGLKRWNEKRSGKGPRRRSVRASRSTAGTSSPFPSPAPPCCGAGCIRGTCRESQAGHGPKMSVST